MSSGRAQKLCLIFAIIVLLSAFSCAFSFLSVHGETAVAASDKDYSYDANEVFLIESQEDFASFATLYNGSNRTFYGKKIFIADDVDLTLTPFYLTSFSGTLDAFGNELKRLSSPLFGTVTANGRVVDVCFSDIDLVGAMIGTNAGRLEKIVIDGDQTVRAETNTVRYSPASLTSKNTGVISHSTSNVRFCGNYDSRLNEFGGFACENEGTISDCVFVGDVLCRYYGTMEYVFGGIAVKNTGTITSCAVATEIDFFERDGATNTKLPTIFALTDGGTIEDSFGLMRMQEYSFTINEGDEETPVYVEYKAEAKIAQGTLSGVYGALSVYDGADYSVDLFLSDGTETVAADASDLIEANLGDGFLYGGTYPILSTLLSGEGTALSPYVISDVGDYMRIRVAECCGEYDYAAGYVVDEVGSSSAPVEPTGFTAHYPASSWAVGAYTGASDFGYTLGETPTEVVAETPDGSGTLADPYRITSKEELKYLDGKSGYAALCADVVVNASGNEPVRLSIDSLSVTLFGNGRSVVGLNEEPLCATLSGTVKNFSLVGHGGYVAGTLTGSIRSVTVGSGSLTSGFADDNEGDISDSVFAGTATYAFCEHNAGSVARCVVKGTADIAFTPSEEGTFIDCISYGQDSSTVYTGVFSSLYIDKATPFYAVIDDQDKTVESRLTEDILGDYDCFDFVNGSFAYPVASSLPVLRVYGGEYKENYPDAFSAVPIISERFSEEISYTQEELEAGMTASAILSDTTYVWTFEGETFDGDVHHAGEYTVTATYAGDDHYLYQSFFDSFRIEKGLAPCAITFSEGAFSSLSHPYDGEYFAPAQPTPENASELVSYGYGLTFAFVKDDVAVAYALSCGEYEQTVTASSDDYEDLVLSRTVTIERVPLYVAVGDLSCDYLTEPDLSSVSVAITGGRVPADENKTLSALVGDYSDKFVTDYRSGDDTGEYTVGLETEGTDYYLEVTSGTLTVLPIALSTEGVSFYGATRTERGSLTETYTASPITLAATCPEGVSVVYDGNENVSVGDYEVRATLSKKNYLDLVLTVDLTIEAAPLTVVLPDGSGTYGSGWSVTADPVFEGFLGTDDEALLVGTTFSYYLSKDGEEVSREPSDNLHAGTYDVSSDTACTLRDYFFVYRTGLCKIDKASLFVLYDGSDYADEERFYDGTGTEKTLTYFADHGLSATIAYTVKKDGDPFEAEGAIRDAGTYDVTATVTPTGDLEADYLVTVYRKTVRIKKAVTEVRFNADSYDFLYAGIDRADLSYYDVTTTVGTEELVLTCRKSGAVSAAIHAGDYVLTLSYAGDDNHEPCSAQADLTIGPVPLTMAFRTSYVFSGDRIVPELLSVDGTVSGEEVDQEDLTFAYYRAGGGSLSRVVNTDSYEFVPTIRGGDYYPSEERYTMTVEKLSVEVDIGAIGYLYGTRGSLVLDGVYYNVTESGVTRRNYPTTGALFADIIVNLPSADAGRYVLTDDDLVDSTNYDFSLSDGNHVVTISRRTLSVGWTYNGAEISSPFVRTYEGVSLTGRFSYEVTNLAEGDSARDLHLTKVVTGSAEDVYHVGEYALAITLSDSINYILPASPMNVSVIKTSLQLSLSDVTVEQGENFVAPAITAVGKVGSDARSEVYELKGASINYIHGYTAASRVNARYTVTADAKFDDYEAEVVRTGTLTVVANPYPDYVLSDASYVYDGTYKTLTIPTWIPRCRSAITTTSKRTWERIRSAPSSPTRPAECACPRQDCPSSAPIRI
ncbi:MAG: hypothetical protein IJ735_03215 [Clostridia bacterium]|nr:hypothetical protein [Clostridia bacterium]